jgi:hypothetical protein
MIVAGSHSDLAELTNTGIRGHSKYDNSRADAEFLGA